MNGNHERRLQRGAMRRRRSKSVVAGVAVVALLSALSGTAAFASLKAAKALRQGPESQAESASAQAVASGKRVEVTANRTEFGTTYANPDGFSYTQDESAVPVRVHAAGGGWTTPDPSLQ